MNKLYNLFHIIPIDDNCSFVYKNIEGQYVTKSKILINEDKVGDELIFLSEQEAQNYINRYMDKNKYKVGSFGGNIDLYKKTRRDTSVSFVNGHSESGEDIV